MKIYKKVSWNIETGKILEVESFDYEGPVALAKPKKPKLLATTTTQETRRPELTEGEIEDIVSRTRSGFAARGLAGSGVAQAAETEAIEQARLGTRPTVQTVQSQTPVPPRGVLGLK
jgi:hypothetical protein